MPPCIDLGVDKLVALSAMQLIHWRFVWRCRTHIQDADILSMGLVRAYAPPNTSMETASDDSEASGNPSGQLKAMYDEESRTKEGLDLVEQPATVDFGTSSGDNCAAYAAEA